MKIGAVSGDLVVKLAIAAGVLGALWWLGRRVAGSAWPAVGNTLDNIAQSVNPASDQNLVYRALGSGVSAAAGRETTLGSWLYELTHPAQIERERQAVQGSPPPAAGDLYPQEPASPFNVGA